MSSEGIVKYNIQFGSRVIDFRLEYSDRKSLGITVTPDMEVLVKAPLDAALEKVKEKVRKKAPWIIRQLSFFLSFQPKTPPRRYISGETHLYLGRQYQLKVINDKLLVRNEEVKLRGPFLEAYTIDGHQVRKLVNIWYLEKARKTIEPIAQKLFQSFITKHGLSHIKYNFILRSMPTRWGSCTSKGKIILNPDLIKAPKGCIEYVIIHELCHLIHRNHTQKFIDLQTREMKDWERWKRRLDLLLA